jgi:hypothetical protein
VTCDDRGAALFLTIIAIALMAAIGMSLSLVANTELRVAANYTYAHETHAAAETALEMAARELVGLSDWAGVLAGTSRSGFVDGAPGGTRLLADGSSIDLTQLTSSLGSLNWRPFAHGQLSTVGISGVDAYVVVWIAPDPVQRTEVFVLRADAFGRAGSRRAVEAVVARWGIVSWKELR